MEVDTREPSSPAMPAQWIHYQTFITSQFIVVSLVYSHLANCRQRVTQCVAPFVIHIRTTETKPVVVGQVQGCLISSFVFCDLEGTLPYCFLGYHSLVPLYQKGFREQFCYKYNQRIRNFVYSLMNLTMWILSSSDIK